MKSTSILATIFLFGLLMTSCSKDDPKTTQEPLGAYESGILVSNEGPFGNGTGTVTFISNDLSVTESSIYNKVNGEDLGNIVQSIGFAGDQAYIVANNSNKITVVNRYTFEKLGSITEGLENPRYFAAVNDTGYVTNWGDPFDETDDYVAIVNLQNFTVEGTISVVLGPEDIVANDNTVYVAHQGAYGQNNKVTAIDANTNSILETITVGNVPNSLLLDEQGSLWVLAGGNPSYTNEETAGVLTKINTSNNTVVNTWEFQATDHPGLLCTDGIDMYYQLNGAVFKMSATDSSLPSGPKFGGVSFYTMAVTDGKLYGTDAKDFASLGTLTVYDLSSNSAIKTVATGIIPGGIYFN
ncbi:YncE family protein [Flavobacteriaceae bacterium KMM 6897]|nr:YncE family protein [Flavobacteriaceae bacterium KMM 6897]MEB8347526.1 YncE family protein [Flavobacteriaceae bacterium KMM 6898]